VKAVPAIDPDDDRKAKAFKKMMPNHPSYRMTTDGLPTGRWLASHRLIVWFKACRRERDCPAPIWWR
jgi:hypothetical protein